MSEERTAGGPDVAGLRRLHEARVLAELASADALCPGSDVIAHSGDIAARVVAVKGLPGPAEAAGGPALSGPDGEALKKALSSLGWDSDQVFFTLSRPVEGCDAANLARRLRGIVEAVDPELVVLLDNDAAHDFAAGYAVGELRFGVETRVLGRRVVALDGLERSLTSEQEKRRVWAQLRDARPPDSVY